VAVDLLPGSNQIRRYKLQAYYAFRDAANSISAHTAGYEIEVRNSESGDYSPAELFIKPAELDFSEREWRVTPIVAVASPRPNACCLSAR
jgi:hypothetical protein